MIYFEIATGGFHGYFYYVNRVTLVIIAKLKVCNKLYNLKDLFQFERKKNVLFIDILCN